jgi:hypothetical protein
MRRLLQQMDRRWRKAGLVRQPHETLHQFAARLTAASTDAEYRQAAEWYHRFAALRYGRRGDLAALQSLQQDGRNMAQRKRLATTVLIVVVFRAFLASSACAEVMSRYEVDRSKTVGSLLYFGLRHPEIFSRMSFGSYTATYDYRWAPGDPDHLGPQGIKTVDGDDAWDMYSVGGYVLEYPGRDIERQ